MCIPDPRRLRAHRGVSRLAHSAFAAKQANTVVKKRHATTAPDASVSYQHSHDGHDAAATSFGGGDEYASLGGDARGRSDATDMAALARNGCCDELRALHLHGCNLEEANPYGW